MAQGEDDPACALLAKDSHGRAVSIEKREVDLEDLHHDRTGIARLRAPVTNLSQFFSRVFRPARIPHQAGKCPAKVPGHTNRAPFVPGYFFFLDTISTASVHDLREAL